MACVYTAEVSLLSTNDWRKQTRGTPFSSNRSEEIDWAVGSGDKRRAKLTVYYYFFFLFWHLAVFGNVFCVADPELLDVRCCAWKKKKMNELILLLSFLLFRLKECIDGHQLIPLNLVPGMNTPQNCFFFIIAC